MIIETIYFNIAADPTLDAAVGAAATLAASTPVVGRRGFLVALSEAVERSHIVICVGKTDGDDGLIAIMTKGLGLESEPAEASAPGLADDAGVMLPKGSLPLISENRTVGGIILESGDQSIIAVSSDGSVKGEIIEQYVLPYLAAKIGGENEAAGEAAAADAAEHSAIEPDIGQEPFEEDTARGEETVGAASADSNPTAESQTSKNNDVLGAMMQEDRENGIEIDEIPTKIRRKFNPRLFFVCVGIALAVIAAGCFTGYHVWWIPEKCDRIYSDIRSEYGQVGNTADLPTNIQTKFGSLYHLNQDITGWLRIDGTGIDYPVVSSAARGEEYYQKHLFNGTESKYGTPYINGEYDVYTFRRNMVIYGRNYGDGRMFGGLENYTDLEFYKNNPTFTLDTIYYAEKWKIFSVVIADGDGSEFNYAAELSTSDQINTFIDDALARSVINCAVSVDTGDNFLTLTAPYSGGSGKNIIVVARKVRANEIESVNTDSAAFNSSIVVSSGMGDASSFYRTLTGKSVSALTMSSRSDRITAQYAPAASRISDAAVLVSVSGYVDTDGSDLPVNAVSGIQSELPASSVSSSVSKPSFGDKSYNDSVQSPDLTDGAVGVVMSVRNEFNGRVETGDAVDIVARVVQAEMGSGFETEALKAQAVASYTYLIYQGAADGNTPSAPMKDASTKVYDAVSSVIGQKIYYGGKIINALYFAMSADCTTGSADVWGGSLPYMQSVDTSFESSASNYLTTRKYRASDIAGWVRSQYGIDLSQVDRSDWFSVKYDATGVYAGYVTIGGQRTVRGYQIRLNLFTASRVGSGNTLRSHAFSISYDPSDDCFTFTVKGYGHGVGMSQVGANILANNGADYLSILHYYYTGITIS